ncbi:hypothetical protein BXY57_1443 [Thermoflavifilum aggregans]|uniref:Uncharacterized protein n=1 Tax=Thermoflavifilum aggregans TaxID=454188 RepID=A0A2M9CVA5_9BACT|nr:hypothetical protein [Thermoflavifilum aggregans]PJJ75851.1 hypothetical protein BXY57_1443 [Thermoflavifilum aggregans]
METTQSYLPGKWPIQPLKQDDQGKITGGFSLALTGTYSISYEESNPSATQCISADGNNVGYCKSITDSTTTNNCQCTINSANCVPHCTGS